jgi:hypothetical protein
VTYEDTDRSSYHIENPIKGEGEVPEIAVDFLNHEWYALLWADGHYVTKEEFKLPRGLHGVGWYKDTDRENPERRILS